MFGAALADGDDQFHLVMKLVALRRVGHVGVVQQQRIGRLHEEERRLAVGVAAHLAGMFGVVASDTKDAPDGKTAATGNGNGYNRRRGDDVVSHSLHLVMDQCRNRSEADRTGRR